MMTMRYVTGVKLGNKGFSLIELICVVAIIGILAIIGIPQYKKFKVKAFQAEAKTHLAAIHTAQRSFFLEHNGYHSSLQVIGFAAHGRLRYNVGFGSAGTLPPTYSATYQANTLNTKQTCGGAYGSGADPNCNMIIPTPDIAPTATVNSTQYAATAVAFEDMLTVNTTSPIVNIAAEFLFGSQASAVSIQVGQEPTNVPATGYDGWVIDHNNVLKRSVLVLIEDCIEVGTCGVAQPVTPDPAY
jgi:prepilin-type N-terminal cleavage/methylation domain-containing protein